jgi:hypothetical protein
MNRWSHGLNFLWEEPSPPPTAVGRGSQAESAGVPLPVRRAMRFTLIAFAATSLMGEIIGIRLTAPVDAAPSYAAQCIQNNCKGLTGQARADCFRECQGGNTNIQQQTPVIKTQAVRTPTGGRGRRELERRRSDPRWLDWLPILPDRRSLP